MISANYFNAQRSQAIPSSLTIAPQQLSIHGELMQRNFSRAQIQIAEPYENATLILQFSDGSHCEINDPGDKSKTLAALNYQASMIERWQANWKIALLAILLVVGFFYTAYHVGGPWIAKLVVPKIPQSADDYLGKQSERFLNSAGYFTPTRTSDPQYSQIIMVFRRIQASAPRVPLRLEIVESKMIGANAFALPNGTLFVTDEMYALLSKKDGKLSEAGEQELAGLLAHEIAHVELRHSIHNIVQTSLMTVLVGSMIGDFSTLAATAGSSVLSAQYSQEIEREADEYAIKVLKAAGISPSHLADLFEALESDATSGKNKKRDKFPAWLGNPIEDFLSSHPPSKQRIQRFKEAAQDGA